MYLICVGFTFPTLIFIYSDRYNGFKISDSNFLTGSNTISRYVHENITSFQKTKYIGKGIVAYPTIDTSQGIVAGISSNPRLKFLSWLCSSECPGIEQRNPLLYNEISYFIYQESENNSDYKAYADTFNFNSGEIRTKIPLAEIPKILQNLNDQQLYGLDPLPTGVARIDASWIENNKSPIKILRVGEGCIEIGLAIIILNLIFGSNLILSKLLISNTFKE